ncbi:hypothetical protein GN958_ATG01198, partial [Phytophthora infestans]
IVKINTASRPSGRPKQKESFKKATRSKDITDILAYVDTVATVGDVTLEILDEVLSIAVIGEALDGIRRMFNVAAFNRPKALVIKEHYPIRASRYVNVLLSILVILVSSSPIITNMLNALANILIEPLVLKSIDSATNVKIREELINDTSDIVISILGVGTFSLVDIERMRTWQEFVEKTVIDDDHKEVERQRILHMIPFMYVDSAFSANGHNILFLNREVTNGRVIHVERRNQFIDTNDHIFTEMRSIRIVCCPTYVDIEFPHWCGIIFDMERKLCGIQEVISGVFVKLKTSHVEMPAKTFTRWRQCDGHNCGVLTMQWFEQYLSLVRSTSPDASIPLAHDDKLDPKQLAYERYKYF